MTHTMHTLNCVHYFLCFPLPSLPPSLPFPAFPSLPSPTYPLCSRADEPALRRPEAVHPDELGEACNGFSDDNYLGEGGSVPCTRGPWRTDLSWPSRR